MLAGRYRTPLQSLQAGRILSDRTPQSLPALWVWMNLSLSLCCGAELSIKHHRPTTPPTPSHSCQAAVNRSMPAQLLKSVISSNKVGAVLGLHTGGWSVSSIVKIINTFLPCCNRTFMSNCLSVCELSLLWRRALLHNSILQFRMSTFFPKLRNYIYLFFHYIWINELIIF